MSAYKTITDANKLIERGELTCHDLVEQSLQLIDEHDKSLHAFLLVDRETILGEAKAADERRFEGKARGPLDGIPISIKDVILTQGMETTASSNMLKGFVPPYDATVVMRLRDAGAIILGKTNCDAWAHGSSTENSDFGPTRNPWDLERVPGGSSGGSAAAVAAGMGLASIGTDTGGSIRQPASFCGVTGFKPTYGRLSRYGLIAMASSLDCPGPFTRSAEDASILMNVTSGHDGRDSTSLPEKKLPVIRASKDAKPLTGLKIGLPKEYFTHGMEKQVDLRVQESIKVFTDLGASFVEISLPMTPYALAVYYIIQPAEVSSNLARYDGIRYGQSQIKNQGLSIHNSNELIIANRTAGFGKEAKRRIIMGTHVLSSGYYDAFYKRATQVRTKIIEDFYAAFNKVDLILTPTTPTPAFKFGAKKDSLEMYLEDIFTVSANIAGIPAVSLPCGFAGELPVGLQLMGPHLAEELILSVASNYQRETDWHLKTPAGF